MITIKLKDIIEERSYPEAGEIIYYIIEKAMSQNEKISIDMQDVISVPTMFMNTSFGTFIENFGADKLKQIISFQNILKSQAERISKYIKEYENIIEKEDI